MNSLSFEQIILYLALIGIWACWHYLWKPQRVEAYERNPEMDPRDAQIAALTAQVAKLQGEFLASEQRHEDALEREKALREALEAYVAAEEAAERDLDVRSTAILHSDETTAIQVVRATIENAAAWKKARALARAALQGKEAKDAE